MIALLYERYKLFLSLMLRTVHYFYALGQGSLSSEHSPKSLP
jgi:hypothetical protein